MENFKRLTSLFLALMMLFVSGVSAFADEDTAQAVISLSDAQVVFAEQPRSGDLSDFITDIVIKDGKGNVLGQDGSKIELQLDTEYEFDFTFSENEHGLQFAEGELTYKFPDGLTFTNKSEYPVYEQGDSTKQVGKFVVEGDTMKFIPFYSSDGVNYHEKKQDGDHPYQEWSTTTSLWCKFNGKANKEGDKEIDFGNDQKVNITVIPKETDPKAGAHKEYQLVQDGDDWYILYTVRAEVTNDDAKNLTITDTMNYWNGGKEYFGKPDIANATVKLIRDGAEVTDASLGKPQITQEPVNDWDTTTVWTWSVDNAKKGDIYEISYRVPVNKDKLYGSNSKVTLGNNSVRVDADKDSANDSKNIDILLRGKISKSGQKQNDGKILWTVNIGNHEEAISGTVTDKFTLPEKVSNVTLDAESVVIEYEEYDPTTGTTTTKKLTGADAAKYIHADDLTTSSQFTFDIPTAEEGKEIRFCKVSYKTDGEYKDGQNGTYTVSNDASYDGSHAGSSSEGGTKPATTQPSVEKFCTNEDEKDTAGKLDYKVIITIPKENIGQYISIQDYTELIYDSWHRAVLSYADNKEFFTDFKVSAEGDSGKTKTYNENEDSESGFKIVEGDGYFWVQLGNDVQQGSNKWNWNFKWLWDTDEDVRLTITYSVSKQASAAGKKISDIEDGGVYNKASSMYVSDEVTVRYAPTVEKTASTVHDGKITYTITLNKNHNDPIPENGVLVDTFDPRLSYVEGSLKIKVYTRDQWNTWEVSQPSYTPDSTPGELRIQFGKLDEGKWSSGLQYDWQWTNLLNNYPNIGLTKETYLDSWYYLVNKDGYTPKIVISYDLAIDPDQMEVDKTVELVNNVAMDGYGSDSVKVEYTPEYMKKTAMVNGQSAKFILDVNPDGIKLLKNGGRLQLVDVMTNVSLDLSTLKVYDVSDNGQVELKRGTDWDYGYRYGYATDADGNLLSELTIDLPDETPIQVVYEAVVQGEQGATVTVKNSAKLVGFSHADGSTSNSASLSSGAGGASQYNYKLSILKLAENGGQPLSGAKFNIEYLEDDGTWQSYGSFTTGSEGGLSIDSYSDGTQVNHIRSCTVYRITETEAPDGYLVADPQYVFIKGTYTGTVKQSCKTLEELKLILTEEQKNAIAAIESQIQAVDNAAYITVVDAPKQGISFTKVSAYNEDRLLSGATFTLQKCDENGSPIPGEKVQTQQSGVGTGNVTFLNVEEGTYRLEETNAPSGFDKPQGYWIVTVSDEGGRRSVTFTPKAGAPDVLGSGEGGYKLPNEPTPLIKLPTVGGNGTLAYSACGLTLMALAAALLGAQTRRRKRRGED